MARRAVPSAAHTMQTRKQCIALWLSCVLAAALGDQIGCTVTVESGSSLRITRGGTLTICEPEALDSIPCSPGLMADAEPGCEPLPPVLSNATTNPEYAEGVSVTIGNPVSLQPHIVDGGFTGWEPCTGSRRRLAPRTDPYQPEGCETCAGSFEWCDIVPAVGRFTYAYFDYNGTHLNILNDWLYNDEKPVKPECYNLFNAWTGGGTEQWEIKVYGDGNTTVALNDKLVDANEMAAGRVGWGISPRGERAARALPRWLLHTAAEPCPFPAPPHAGSKAHRIGSPPRSARPQPLHLRALLPGVAGWVWRPAI